MSVTNFNLRGITTEVMSRLKYKAKKQHTSINLLIIKLIEQGIGYSHEVKKNKYHDLDDLAGSWSAKDAKVFEKNTKFFEKIDPDLWS